MFLIFFWQIQAVSIEFFEYSQYVPSVVDISRNINFKRILLLISHRDIILLNSILLQINALL
jgi:hypothetical protein